MPAGSFSSYSPWMCPVAVRLEYEELINCAMEHNVVRLARRLEVENIGEEPLEMLEVAWRS